MLLMMCPMLLMIVFGASHHFEEEALQPLCNLVKQDNWRAIITPLLLSSKQELFVLVMKRKTDTFSTFR